MHIYYTLKLQINQHEISHSRFNVSTGAANLCNIAGFKERILLKIAYL